jgi:translation initiation factor IF-2
LAKAKGIRISELAKETGFTATVILKTLHDEGIPEADAYKASSNVSLGLAATIRDWAGDGTLQRAVEASAPSTGVAVAEKPKRAPPRRKSSKPGEDSHEEPHPDADVHAPAIEHPATPVVAEVPETLPTHEPVVVQKATPVVEVTAPVIDTPPPVAVPVITHAVEPLIAPLAEIRYNQADSKPAPAKTAPRPPTAPSVSPIGPRLAGMTASQLRPKVSLDEKLNAEGRGPKPLAFQPKAATVKGPAVVRVEKPDIVQQPRPRGPRGPGFSEPQPAQRIFTGTRPTGGRGAKITAAPEESEDAARKAVAKAPVGRRRGPDGRRGEADEKLREFSQADLLEREERIRAATSYRTGVDQHLRKSQPSGRGPAQSPQQRGGFVEVEEPITVKTLSSSIGVKANEILSKLIKKGVFATINQGLDFDTAQTIAMDFGVEIVIAKAPTLEEQLIAEFESRDVDPANLVLRPPVVTILGHVDHGKTSLLDKIRSANVAAGESGGITQHIAAFSVELDRGGERKRVTFIDTPGHQAFTAMRARGANMTDVAVLVVDAAQGIQPQTLESINHARAAKVPIVVALNKIDLPNANPDMVMGQLAGQDLSPVAWGGQTEVVKTSGLTGAGIEELIEILDLQSQVLELQADPTSPARGTVIEARVDPGLGSVATVLVQDGTLRVGDAVIAGMGYGRVRSMLDSTGRPITEAGPSSPVLVAGLSEVPSAGDKLFVIEDVDRAKSIAEERVNLARQQALASQTRVSLETVLDTMKDQDVKTINLIVKADVQGSVETLIKTVTDHNTDEVKVRVIHAAVGAINESDVDLATASGAVIIGFHVVPDPSAAAMAEQRRIEIRTYRVIYEIFDDLKKALSGMLEPEIREKHHGWIDIRQVFKVSKVGTVAGCFVSEGFVSRGSKIRLVRDGSVITENLLIETLRRIKEDVKEVKQGFECGLKLTSYDDVKIGDRLQAYVREEIKRTL